MKKCGRCGDEIDKDVTPLKVTIAYHFEKTYVLCPTCATDFDDWFVAGREAKP